LLCAIQALIHFKLHENPDQFVIQFVQDLPKRDSLFKRFKEGAEIAESPEIPFVANRAEQSVLPLERPPSEATGVETSQKLTKGQTVLPGRDLVKVKLDEKSVEIQPLHRWYEVVRARNSPAP